MRRKKTQEDFEFFYQCLIHEAKNLDVFFEPRLLMQDACPASRNAVFEFFPKIDFLPNVKRIEFVLLKNLQKQRRKCMSIVLRGLLENIQTG